MAVSLKIVFVKICLERLLLFVLGHRVLSVLGHRVLSTATFSAIVSLKRLRSRLRILAIMKILTSDQHTEWLLNQIYHAG